MPDGIEYHAHAVRTFGAVAALIPMAVSGLVSLLMLWGSQSAWRGIVGFVLAVLACPTLPIFGFPLAVGGTKLLGVIATSALVWIALGVLAARRATTHAIVGWPEWRREWTRLALGVWIGSFVGFAIAGVLLTVDI